MPLDKVAVMSTSIGSSFSGVRRTVEQVMPGAIPVARRLRRRVRRTLVRPSWGNLRRMVPFSPWYGVERGLPVDRIYISQFMDSHAQDIRGEVLEVLDSQYTERCGGDRVRTRHVVDIDPSNPRATWVADLSEPTSLPEEQFDCIILTQTLQFLGDLSATWANLRRALRPGGVLLLTVPVVTLVEFTQNGTDYWRIPPDGLRALLTRAFPGAEVEVRGRGNLLTSIAFLLGLAAEDLQPQEFELDDPKYPLVSLARVRMPTAEVGPASIAGQSA